MSELTKLCKSSLETRPKVSVVAIRIKSSKYIVSQRGRMETSVRLDRRRQGDHSARFYILIDQII